MLKLSDALGEFESITADITRLRGFMAQAESVADEASRQYLAVLGKAIDESIKELKEKLPESVAYLQKTRAENTSRMEDLKATMADLQRQGEELEEKAKREAAAPVRPTRPIPSVTALRDAEVDLKVRTYREELLRLLVEHREPAGEVKTDREIWQGWSRIEEE